MTRYILFGITYAFAAAVQPGPFQTFIISRTLSAGWKRTLPAAFAPVLSDIPILIVVLLMLSRVGDGFFRFLHLGGGVFLLYLSYRSFTAWRTFDEEKAATLQSGQQTLFQAALVNLLNPNPYIGWSLIMGPLFLTGWRDTPLYGIALLGAFYSTLIISLAGIILLFAFARTLGPRVNRVSVGLSAVALALFGFYQVWLGFHVS